MIFLETSAGLCNRMRSIASAYNIAKKNNVKLIVIWPINKDCKCGFYDLFKKTDMFVFSVNKHEKRILKLLFLAICKKHIIDKEEKIEKKIEDVIHRGYSIYIESIFQFSDVDLYRVFKPKEYIISKSQEIIKQRKCIGIHIRRTDNIESIAHSPTHKFTEKIREKIANNNQFIFVSTDDVVEQSNMVNEFGEMVLFNENKTFDRKTKKGMIDACVDLYCLSLCEEIIGSYWSSFSAVAAQWNSKRKTEIIRS